MKTYYSLLALSVGLGLSHSANADINDIIISEYVEGTGNNRAIELTNIGNETHTFDKSVSLYHKHGSSHYINAILSPKKQPILEGLSIQPNTSLVIYNPEAKANIESIVWGNGGQAVAAGAYKDVQHGTLSFNGRSAIFLAESGLTGKQSPKNIKDIVGRIGDAGWGGEDITLRRVIGSTPSDVYNREDWASFPLDTFEGLGNPSLASEPDAPLQVCTDSDIGKIHSVADIQGPGDRSPMVAEGEYRSKSDYLLKGTVAYISKSFEYTDSNGKTRTVSPYKDWRGVYLQDKNRTGTGSNGIYVKLDGLSQDLVGKEICFKGKVEEYFGRTQFTPSVSDYEVMSSSYTEPHVTKLEIIDSDYDENGKLNFKRTLERHEGMLISLPKDINPSQEGNQDMRVSRTFSFDYADFRNNMVLSYERPNVHPNQVHVAGSEEAQALHQENLDRRLYIESDVKAPDGQIPYFEAFYENPNHNVINVNDGVNGMVGVLDYSRGEYRLIPTEQVKRSTFKKNTPRTTKPKIETELDNGEFLIKVASSNVLNYFNSPFGGDRNNHGENRGAMYQDEFELQEAKIVKAMYELDADIIGLMEVENNGFGNYGAISQLVDELNREYTEDRYSRRNNQNSIHNRYRFVGIDSNGDTLLDNYDHIGTDAITNGLIYRPSKVTLESARIIKMPRQDAPPILNESGDIYVDSQGRPLSSGKAYQRDTIVATFLINNTGKKVTVAVNHFKSKGSNCIDDWDNWDTNEEFVPGKSKLDDSDLQGQCENFRVAAAHQLGSEMAKIPGDQIILGDLNAYAYEDPVLVLTANPTKKDLRAGQHTYIGDRPQFGKDQSGVVINQTFGYLNAVKLMDEKWGRSPSWSFSFNDTLGALDHVLVSPSMKHRLNNAVDWHINSTESPLFDYTRQTNGRPHKGEMHENFHKDSNGQEKVTPFRSSDHDPVITALTYKYAEPGRELPLFVTKSGRAEIPYVISELVDAQPGDQVVFNLEPKQDQVMNNVTTSSPLLTKEGAQTAKLEVNGAQSGKYRFTMYLEREGNIVANSTVSFEGQIKKPDSLEAGVTIPPYDETGGSTGLWSLLALFGIGAARRLKARR